MTDIEPLGGTTTGGLPWPASTDSLSQGANDIKALALALDTRGWGNRVESRKVTAAFTGGVATINFLTAFKTMPMVIWSPGWPFGNNNLALSAGLYASAAATPPITAAGFSLICYQIGPAAGWYSGNVDVYYTAIGPTL